MGTEEGGHDAEWRMGLYALGDTQNFQLILGRQSVARLDFHTSCAFLPDLLGTAHGLLEEVLLARLVETVGRIEDATAAGGNLGIGQSLEFVLKLLLTAACPDQVGMAVAEARHDEGALSVDDLCVLHQLRRHAARAEIQDFVVLDGDPCVCHRLYAGHLLSRLAQLSVGDATELGDVGVYRSHCLRII